MREDFRNKLGIIVSHFCARVVKDMHHLGVAIVPVLCERLVWVAILSLGVFFALAAIQSLMEEV